MKRYLGFMLMPLLFSCSLYPTAPMETMRFSAGQKPAKHLVILLAGRGAPASYFKDHKWVEMARQYGIQADFIAPYAHYGYYMTRKLLPRLNEDVIIPAKQQGYKSISLVGISMGGLGSILYSERFPKDIDRLFLFAPYLGDTATQQEIRSKGGLKNWRLTKDNQDDWNHYIWQRLKEITEDPAMRNKIFLGYGQQDGMQGIDILAQSMPKNHVISVPGGHRDVVFTRLWQIMLDKGFLAHPSTLAEGDTTP
ncbi:MAG: alpha/beta hydrolase-fold protein [Thioalkalispiraceae bacterium]|jgi:pimeloyl-ACP methyl ester carboxylesterase